jgi:hypothetical protein
MRPILISANKSTNTLAEERHMLLSAVKCKYVLQCSKISVSVCCRHGMATHAAICLLLLVTTCLGKHNSRQVCSHAAFICHFWGLIATFHRYNFTVDIRPVYYSRCMELALWFGLYAVNYMDLWNFRLD